jgi:N6-adenosine-specific RNA methylase IME4
VVLWIRTNQLGRRNLTDDQRAMIAVAVMEIESKLAMQERAQTAVDARETKAGRKTPILEAAPSSKIKPKKDRTRAKTAKIARVSQRKLRQAAELKKLSKVAADKVTSGELGLADALREEKKKEVVANLESTATKQAKELAGVFDVIVIDPPWPMEKIERDERVNQSAFDYPTMDEAALLSLKIPAHSDCHLWLWTTHRFLPMAFRLLDAWKFKYVCCFTWHKPGAFQPVGLPQFNCEFAIYARQGSPKFVDTKAFPVCFNAPRGKHSEKPEEFYATVRRVTAGRRADLFNRRKIEGFEGWGKEAK